MKACCDLEHCSGCLEYRTEISIPVKFILEWEDKDKEERQPDRKMDKMFMNWYFPEEHQMVNKHVKLTTIISHEENTHSNHSEMPTHI